MARASLTLAWFVAATASGAHAQTLTLNLADAFAPVKARFAAGQTGRIVVIGDSLAYREGTWLPVYRSLLQADHGNAGLGFMDFSPWSGGSYGAGWTVGLIGSDTVPHRSLTGMWSLSPATTGWSSYAAGSATRFTLMIAGEPGAGAVSIQPAGGPAAPLNGASANNELRTATISSASALGSVVCTTSGPVTMLGVVLETGATGALVHRVANGGWGVDNYLQRDWTFDAQLSALAPDLVYIWLGQNDQGASQPVYESKMNQLVDRVQTDAPATRIVLVGTWDAGGSAIPVLVAAMQSVAAQRGLGFINLYAAGGTYDYYWGNGYLDGFHFSPAGGQYVGQMMHDAFVTNGADFCDVHFLIHPASHDAASGYPASLHVVACAGTGETYRWRRDGVDLFDNGHITGAATPDLLFDVVATSDAGLYDVRVTGPCGTAISNGANFTVNAFCPSDYNRDGFVTGDDFDAFVNEFEWGTPDADFDGNGFVTGDDFDSYVAAFETGC